MRQKFSTAIRLAAGRRRGARFSARPAVAAADARGLQNRVPDHLRRCDKGDTLWGIAGKFLKDPVALARGLADEPRRDQEPAPDLPGRRDRARPRRVRAAAAHAERPSTRLSPTVRIEAIDAEAIPSIPPGDIDAVPVEAAGHGTRRPRERPARSLPARDDRVIRGDERHRLRARRRRQDGRPLATSTAPAARWRRSTPARCSATSSGTSAPASRALRRGLDRADHERDGGDPARRPAGADPRRSASSTTPRTRRTSPSTAASSPPARDSTEVGPRLHRHASTGAAPTASTWAPCSRSTARSADIVDPRPSNVPEQ